MIRSPLPLAGLRICMLVTNDVSRDARVQKEAKSAAAAGAEVVVIGVGHAEQQWQPDSYELRLIEPMRASHHPIRFVRIVQNLSRERAFEQRMTMAAREVAADIIHCNDLDTLRPGTLAARATGARVVYDAHELSTEGGVLKWWQRLALAGRERRLASRADAVVTVNKPIAGWLKVHRGLRALPTVVMNGPAECREGTTVPDDAPVRLLFQGNFFYDRNIEAAINCMPQSRGRAILTLQGWGEAEEALRRLVDDLGVQDCVRFVPPCGPLEVVEHARQHDVGLILHKPLTLNHRYSSPNKLFDYLGAGLAVVAPALPVFEQIIGESGCGALFRHDEEPGLLTVLETLLSDRAGLQEMKRRSAVACHEFCWPTQAQRLVSLYARIAATKASP